MKKNIQNRHAISILITLAFFSCTTKNNCASQESSKLKSDAAALLKKMTIHTKDLNEESLARKVGTFFSTIQHPGFAQLYQENPEFLSNLTKEAQSFLEKNPAVYQSALKALPGAELAGRIKVDSLNTGTSDFLTSAIQSWSSTKPYIDKGILGTTLLLTAAAMAKGAGAPIPTTGAEPKKMEQPSEDERKLVYLIKSAMEKLKIPSPVILEQAYRQFSQKMQQVAQQSTAGQ